MDEELETSRESRLRRAAKRQGLVLMKSRVRNPDVLEYGNWRVSDQNNCLVFGSNTAGATLDQVEEWLRRRPKP